MKRLTALLLSGALLLLSGCSADPAEPSSADPSLSEPDSSTTAPSDDLLTTDTETTGNRSLVVYFSWSGNTEALALEIQSQTGADLFEILPETPYTEDYSVLVDQAQQEQAEGARPAISSSIDNLSEYDTIYLGYPSWWSDMPMVLYTFLDSYDLSGKTICPFVTSGGSGLAGTVEAIRELEPNATVTEGLAVSGSAAADSAEAVIQWLTNIGTLQNQ